MRIGVVGDTHNQMTNVTRIVELFEEAGVTRIVHTGDITQPSVLDRFTRLEVPLVGVFGNNDRSTREPLAAFAHQFGMDLVDPPLTLEWSGRRILVTHSPDEVPELATNEVDLVLHGHTHRHRHERLDDVLYFNPGECAGMMAGRNAVGIVDLDSLEPELLSF